MLKGLAVALLALYCLILIVLSLVADYAGGIWAVSGVTGAVALGAAGFLFLLNVRVFASALLIVGGVLAGGAAGIWGGWGQPQSGFWGIGARSLRLRSDLLRRHSDLHRARSYLQGSDRTRRPAARASRAQQRREQ